MGHPFSVSGVLKFAITTADLAVGTEMVAFAEDHGQHKFAGFADLFCIRFNNHIG